MSNKKRKKTVDKQMEDPSEEMQEAPDGKDAEFEVGYKRPPMHSRFPPGRSGNPRGRSKGLKNFKTNVAAVLATAVKITRDGKSRKISTLEAALLRLREKALGGDSRALDKLLQLAQIYQNEEEIERAALPADDAAVLKTYLDRLASGAADDIAPVSDAEADAPSPKPEQPARAKIPRYRSKKPD